MEQEVMQGKYRKKLPTWRADSPLWEGRAQGPFYIAQNGEGLWEVTRSDGKIPVICPSEAEALAAMDGLYREWEEATTERVYFIGTKLVIGRLVKIGTSVKPALRLAQLQYHCPVKLNLFTHVPGGVAVEASYHIEYAQQRQHGEWFTITPKLKREIEGLAGANAT